MLKLSIRQEKCVDFCHINRFVAKLSLEQWQLARWQSRVSSAPLSFDVLSQNQGYIKAGDTYYIRLMFSDTRVFDLTNRHMGIMDNTPGFSMEERDPNNINLHLQVSMCLHIFV